MASKELTRRSFISGAAAAAGTAAILGTGVAFADEAEEEAAAEEAAEEEAAETEESAEAEEEEEEGYTPSFLVAPDPIDDADISETVDADIVIIGSALSGLCACRSAVENGATNVVVIEKGTTFQYRSNQVGTIGGKIQEDLGIEIDKNAAVGQIMKECGYRPNQRILNLWADYSGEAFDWFLEPLDGQYVVEAESDPYDEEEGALSVRKTHWPEPENSNTADDYYPIFSDCQILLPDMGAWVEATYNICVDNGVTFRFSTWARQLIRENNEGPVTGVICQDIDGNYIKVNASKAVLLATGDFGGNSEMVEYYVPWASRFSSAFPNTDAAGERTNTGDGQCMGMWIGAKMEDGPYAPMTHHLGGPLGVDAFLLVDIYGDRFCNEDVGGQPIQNQLSRLPQKTAWQIFDANWPDQLQYMDCGHGNVSWYVDDEDVPGGSYGRNAYISQEDFDEAMASGGVQADTIEELAELMEVDAEELQATIDRYNELANAGEDEDFGKRADRMFPIENPPYYAYKFTDTVMLVCMGGLQTNVDFQVLDTDDEVIERLYAVGNTQGGRILVDYPLPCPGISHGMAMTHGMLVGRILAEL